MTAPHIKIPDDTPQFPDVEQALITVVGDMLTELNPTGVACNVPPQDFERRIQAGHAVVQIERRGGGAERTIDRPRVFISVITEYRSDSNRVMQWLRAKLHNFTGRVNNPDGTTAIIAEITDITGPERGAPYSPDSRVVTAGFTVATRLER